MTKYEPERSAFADGIRGGEPKLDRCPRSCSDRQHTNAVEYFQKKKKNAVEYAGSYGYGYGYV